MELTEIRDKNYNLESDSNCDAWSFYFDYYHDDEKMNLSESSLRKQGYRLIHPICGLPDCYWGGDVIINVKRMPSFLKEKLIEKLIEKQKKLPERYDYCNIGLLPCQGNFQIIKNRCGCDYRIDLFIKLIDEYYKNNDVTKLLNKAKMWKNNEDRERYTKLKIQSVLNYLGGDGSALDKTKQFVNTIYGIENEEFINKILKREDEIKEEEEYVVDLIMSFWELRSEEIPKRTRRNG